MENSSDTKTVQVGSENKGMLLYVFQQKLKYTNLFTRFMKKSNSFQTEQSKATHTTRHSISQGGCISCHL